VVGASVVVVGASVVVVGAAVVVVGAAVVVVVSPTVVVVSGAVEVVVGALVVVGADGDGACARAPDANSATASTIARAGARLRAMGLEVRLKTPATIAYTTSIPARTSLVHVPRQHTTATVASNVTGGMGDFHPLSPVRGGEG